MVEGFFIFAAKIFGNPGLNGAGETATVYAAGAAAVKDCFAYSQGYGYILMQYICICIYILQVFKGRVA